jgi:Ca2+-binding EF-hand superfamily protein
MNAAEFKQVLVDLGKRDVTDQQVLEMLKQVDRNNDNVIQWVEFIDVRKI